MTRILLGIALLFASGCAGGLHERGDRQLEIAGFYGEPTGGKPFLDGDGTAGNFGLRFAPQWFVRDRVAVGGAVTPLRLFQQDGGNAPALEVQAGVRYHALSRRRWSLFGELWGGLLYAYDRSIPQDGTQFNFTIDAGAGVEVLLDDHTSLVVGYRAKHLSNGRGRVEGNPSQNDKHVYVGLLFDW